METKRNDEVCFCVSLRLATLVVLWLNTVCGLSGFLTAIVYAYDDRHQWERGFGFYLILYDQIAWVLFSFLALYGALMKEPKALKPLIALWIIRLTLYCLVIVFTLFGSLDSSAYLSETVRFVNRKLFKEMVFEWKIELATILSMLISLFIGAYMTLIIHTYQNKLDEEKYEEYKRLITEEISCDRSRPAEYYPPPTYYQSVYSESSDYYNKQPVYDNEYV